MDLKRSRMDGVVLSPSLLFLNRMKIMQHIVGGQMVGQKLHWLNLQDSSKKDSVAKTDPGYDVATDLSFHAFSPGFQSISRKDRLSIGACIATMMTVDTVTGDEMTGDRNGLCHVSH
jgi:hypothetical protein